MKVAVSVSLQPAAIEIEPGDEARVEVSISNMSDIFETYEFEFRGLPEHARPALVPPTCTVHPSDTHRLQLTITFDPQRPLAAGRHQIGVVVRSSVEERRTAVFRCEELIVEMRAAPALFLAAQPEVVSARDGYADLTVTNGGNTVLDVELDGMDKEGVVRLRFATPRVRVQPYQEATVRVRPSARRPLIGAPLQREITLRGRSGEVQATAPLILSQRPVFAGGMVRLVGAVAGLAVVAGAIIFAAIVGVRAIADAVSRAEQLATTPPTLTAPSSSTGSSQSPSSSTGPSPTSPSSSAGPSPTSPTSPSSSAGPPPTSPSSSTGPPPTSPTSTGPSGPHQIHLDLMAPPTEKWSNQQIAATDYPGIVLSAESDPTRAECANVSAVSWVMPSPPAYAGGVVPGGTDASGSTARVCGDLALRIDLLERAREVTLRVVGQTKTDAGTQGSLPYIARAKGANQAARKTLEVGESGTLTLTDGSGQGLRSVTLSGEPPNKGIMVVLTEVTAVSAP